MSKPTQSVLLGLSVFLLNASLGCAPKDQAPPCPCGTHANAVIETPKLSRDTQASLDLWKTKLIKACDAGDAFSAPITAGRGIDSTVLQSTSDAPGVARGAQGTFLAFGKPVPVQASSKTFWQEDKVKVEFRAENETCRVLMQDQEVFQTRIWSKIPVIAQYLGSPNTIKPVKTMEGTRTAALVKNGWTRASVFELLTLTRLSLLSDSMASSAQWLADLFHSSADKILPFLDPSTLSDLPNSIIPLDTLDSPPLSLQSPLLFGQSESVPDLYEPKMHSLRFKWVLRAPVEFLESRFRAINGWSFQTHYLIAGSWTRGALITQDSLTLSEPRGPEDRFARNCIKTWWKFYSDIELLPSYSQLARTCEPLASSLENLWTQDRRFLPLFGAIFSVPQPGNPSQQIEWKTALIEVISAMIAHQEKNWDQLLDPKHRSPVIQKIAKELENTNLNDLDENSRKKLIAKMIEKLNLGNPPASLESTNLPILDLE